MVEKLKIWVAFHVPRWLAYWCAIRVAAHGTQGPYSNQAVPDLTIMEALKRWDASRG